MKHRTKNRHFQNKEQRKQPQERTPEIVKPTPAVKPATTPAITPDVKYAGYNYKELDCHTGNVLLNVNSPLPIYGGGRLRNVEFGSEYFMLACGVPITPNFELYNVNYKPLQDRRYSIVALEWRDYGIPNLDLLDWKAIVGAWLASKKPLLAFCQGGHGRTGTALAIIIGILGLSTTPVRTVRKAYCLEAIETVEQTRYVAKITGLPSEEELIKPAWDKTWMSYKYKKPAKQWYQTTYEQDQLDEIEKEAERKSMYLNPDMENFMY